MMPARLRTRVLGPARVFWWRRGARQWRHWLHVGKGEGNVHHKGAAERQKGKSPSSVCARAGRGKAGTTRRVHSRVIAENTWSVTWSGFVCCSGTGAIYAPPPAPGASPQRTTSRGWSVQKDGLGRLENAIPAGTRAARVLGGNAAGTGCRGMPGSSQWAQPRGWQDEAPLASPPGA